MSVNLLYMPYALNEDISYRPLSQSSLEIQGVQHRTTRYAKTFLNEQASADSALTPSNVYAALPSILHQAP